MLAHKHHIYMVSLLYELSNDDSNLHVIRKSFRRIHRCTTSLLGTPENWSVIFLLVNGDFCFQSLKHKNKYVNDYISAVQSYVLKSK